MKYIVTHSGRAHRDEFYAVGLAAVLFGITKVFRREPTTEELEDPDVLVVDVGRQFNPTWGNFDHHQLPRGTKECALSLMAKWFEVPHELVRDLCGEDEAMTFKDLWERAPWYRGVVLQDALGLPGLAAELGLGNRIPEELISGIEVYCLQEFARGEEVAPIWVLFARNMVEAKVRTAIEFLRTQREIAENHEILDLGEMGKIFWAPEMTPFGINRFIEENEIDAVVTVTKDPRSGGLCLYRLTEDYDFSRIVGLEKVIFAHQAGFMATIEPGSPREHVELLLAVAHGRE